MSSDQLLYSPDEAAPLLGIGKSTLFELIARGEIESFKIGKLRKIPREALTAYVKRLREESAARAS